MSGGLVIWGNVVGAFGMADEMEDFCGGREREDGRFIVSVEVKCVWKGEDSDGRCG